MNILSDGWSFEMSLGGKSRMPWEPERNGFGTIGGMPIMTMMMWGGMLWFGMLWMWSIALWAWRKWAGRRIHYVEVHELKWCPKFLREYVQLALCASWCMFGWDWLIGSPARTVANVVMKHLLEPWNDTTSITNATTTKENSGLSNGEGDDNHNHHHSDIVKNEMTKDQLYQHQKEKEQTQHHPQPHKGQKKKHVIWLDLCSGGGGPSPKIHEVLKEEHQVSIDTYLSDLYPTFNQWNLLSRKHQQLYYINEPVDALSWNGNLENGKLVSSADALRAKKEQFDVVTVRSMYGSLHHFHPHQIVQMLSNCIQHGYAFVGVELFLNRDLMTLIKFPLVLLMLTPMFLFAQIKHLLFLAQTPWYKKVANILLCIITVPVWEALMIHDGSVSCARFYTNNEILKLAELANHHASKQQSAYTYKWKIVTEQAHMPFIFRQLLPMSFLIGMPVPIKE